MSNIDNFLVFCGSNPSIPYFIGVLCRAKKRKKYTRYTIVKTKKASPKAR